VFGLCTDQLSRQRPSENEFVFTPDMSQAAGSGAEVRCQVHAKDSGQLLANDTATVTVVFGPQPLEDVFVTVERLGAAAHARLEVRARPVVGRAGVVWKPADTFQPEVRPDSREPGYDLTVQKEGRDTTAVELRIDRVREEDLAAHIVTVESELGSQRYTVGRGGSTGPGQVLRAGESPGVHRAAAGRGAGRQFGIGAVQAGPPPLYTPPSSPSHPTVHHNRGSGGQFHF
jgi:hypothetical protein